MFRRLLPDRSRIDETVLLSSGLRRKRCFLPRQRPMRLSRCRRPKPALPPKSPLLSIINRRSENNNWFPDLRYGSSSRWVIDPLRPKVGKAIWPKRPSKPDSFVSRRFAIPGSGGCAERRCRIHPDMLGILDAGRRTVGVFECGISQQERILGAGGVSRQERIRTAMRVRTVATDWLHARRAQ